MAEMRVRLFITSESVTKLLLVLGCLLLGVCSASRAGAGGAASSTNNALADADLLAAVVKGDVSQVSAAIAAGGNPNARVTTNLPALLQLMSSTNAPLKPEYRQCVALLVEAGAGQGAVDQFGRTPLILATKLGDLETVRLLVETGANVTARDQFHKTALFYAVEAHRRDIVAYLAHNGDLQSLPHKPAGKTGG